MPDLPRNVEVVRELLATGGPTSAAELKERLFAQDIVLSDRILGSLPDRYPEVFALDGVGRLALVSQISEVVADRPVTEDGDWLRSEAEVAAIPLDRIVVIDIETTGLDRTRDAIWQIAAHNLGTAESQLWDIACDGRPCSDPVGGVVTLEEALDALAGVLGDAGAVAGHRVGQFDLPFLESAAQRVGRVWSCPLPVLDLHALSVLVDPSLTSRTLVELARTFDVAHPHAHLADHDAATTAALIRHLVGTIYDPEEPSWQVAWRCLHEGRDPWARVLAKADSAALDVGRLMPRRDELITNEASEVFHSGVHAAEEGLARLHALVAGHSERPSQKKMAMEVGRALDLGSDLAVEAPTGTGKSLAYLLPAAGWAQESERPVVIATHTKVLQRQLREEAARLREGGLLPVPFRQIQGVGNYVCTRNLVQTIESHEAEGSEWFALAVAARALVVAPNGVWDDVTDSLLVRDDLRYARQRWSLATTTNDCERRNCAFVDRCPLYQRLPVGSEPIGILSVNHALVASWVKLRATGARAPGDVLGDDHPTPLIFDEAHTLEDSLSSAWAASTGAADLHGQIARLWGRHGPIRRAAANKQGNAGGGSLGDLRGMRRPLEGAMDRLGEAIERYLHEFGRDQQVVLMPAVRSRGEFRALAGAAREVAGSFGRIRKLLIAVKDEAKTDEGSSLSRQAVFSIDAAIKDLSDRVGVLLSLASLPDPQATVHVLTAGDDDAGGTASRWVYNAIPIEVGRRFMEDVIQRSHATVLTSATLTVGGSFAFLGSRLGFSVDDDPDLREQEDEPERSFRTVKLESPFDHDKQSAVVLTSHLPLLTPAGEEEFCRELAADQVGFLSLTGGRELGLFAARSRMMKVAASVRIREQELAGRGVELLVQGEQSPLEIGRRFRDREGTVLYGLRSYWEGFDAPGETLSYLMIEKPPYPHPGDALHAARVRVLEDRGVDAFARYTVPLTAIVLAQGFGRLVRNEADRGVALMCDRRLQQPRPHNDVLLGTLPTSNIHLAIDRDDAWTYAIRFVTGVDPDLSLALELPVDARVALLEELRLESGEDPTEKLQRAAAELFGIPALRPEQLDLMRAVLAGRDALGYLPTGFGKSICFQLPALLHPDQRPTVVVSPLVALIKDQVDDLRGRRGLRGVAGITGRTSVTERTETLRDLTDGKIRLLYVSPERLVRDPNLRGALAQQELGAIVVDEAHCVSAWGHDFRPEFRQIAKALGGFERSPRLALTATATEDVASDIESTLGMQDPAVTRASVDRRDLRYWVYKVSSERERTRELLRFIAHQGDSPGIVYAGRRALTEELAWIIRQTGVTARSYHGAMEPNQREAVQEDYLAGTTQVIVATKAFGMGVNKPDIAWVVHYDLPESLEGYAQESGRAARAPDLDGDCLLLVSSGDFARRRRQVARQSEDEDVKLARRILAEIAKSPMRGGDHVFAPEELADRVGTESDVLNVALAWLERLGNVERLTDVSTRGHLTIGVREPTDPAERLQFVKLLKHRLKCRVGARRQFALMDVAVEADLDPDVLEAQLIAWSLQRLVTFQVTQRDWRVRVDDTKVDFDAFRSLVGRWRQVERARLEAMITYADRSRCRRVLIAEHFGDVGAPCDADEATKCDVCVGSEPYWHAVPLQRVVDPEQLVDVRLVALQAVAWASRYTQGRYGEVSLKAALCGVEALGAGRPISQGLLNCPQFGALRYVRSNDKRLDEAVDELLRAGAVVRERADHQGHTYQSLAITDHGMKVLEGVV